MRETISETIERWLEPSRARSIARYYVVVLQGISIQALDGATREELENVVQEPSSVFRRQR